MKRLSWRAFLPKSLAGQLIGLLLIALFVAQAISVWIFHDERRIALIAVARDNLLTRSASIARLLEDTPASLHDRILEASSSRFSAFWVSDTPAVAVPGDDGTEIRLETYMAEKFDPPREVRIELSEPTFGSERKQREQGEEGDRSDRNDNKDGPTWTKRFHEDRSYRPRRILRRHVDLSLAIPLADGRFLNVATSYRPPPRAIAPLLVQLGLMALAIVAIVAFAVRQASRPLRNLADAAEKLGRGEDIPPLAETGPSEVRTVTKAFNDMQDRLTRFVRDRTRMLAAISHDLRTPITSLRIRAEFIEDEENRDKIIETLDEMAQMTEAALAFARDEANREEMRPVDLGGLLESLAGDQQDLGHEACVDAPERVVLACRPVSLKRAFRNLIENGIRYGEAVEIALSRENGDAVVTISDSGPGIPEERLEDVFEPFVRLEESRSEETGGIGLGLAITRSIIHAHGGTIELTNRPGGGLKVLVRLPANT
jgi:signal transduction histidine kinase